MSLCALGNVEFFKHLFIALKYLYGIPALLLLRHIMEYSFLDMSDSMLNRSAESMLRNGLSILCSIYCSLGCFIYSRALQSRYFNYLAAKLLGKLRNVDLVAALVYNIHHVDRNDNRYTQLYKLSCEVEISFKVCTVNYIEYSVRSCFDKIISCNNFFKGVRR